MIEAARFCLGFQLGFWLVVVRVFERCLGLVSLRFGTIGKRLGLGVFRVWVRLGFKL